MNKYCQTFSLLNHFCHQSVCHYKYDIQTRDLYYNIDKIIYSIYFLDPEHDGCPVVVALWKLATDFLDLAHDCLRFSDALWNCSLTK